MKWLAASLAVGAVVVATAPAAAADTSGRVVDVSTDTSGHVSLTLSAPGLPSGAGLDPATVKVRIDGHPVPATASTASSRQATARSTAMLVVDTSGSMKGAGISAARQAAAQFLAAAPADVKIGLETFSTRPIVLVAPTTDRDRVVRALPGLQAQGETALFDALATAASSLSRSEQRRLVVISDGGDTVSHLGLSSVLKTLNKVHVAVEVVALHTAESDNAVLRRITSATGGRFVLANDGAALAAALQSSARAYAVAVNVRAAVPSGLWGAKRNITVAIDSSAGLVTGTSALTIGPAVIHLNTRRPVSQAASTRLLWVGLLGIAAALVLCVVALFGGDAANKRRARRLVDSYTLTPEATSKRKADLSSLSRTALGVADRIAKTKGLHAKLTMRLLRAGVSFTPSEWLLLLVGIAFATALFFVVLGMQPAVAVLAGVVVGPLLGHLFLGVRASRRRAAFIAALPDTLQLIAGSLSAGYSLAQSMDGVVSEGSQPIAGELGRALAESRLGVPIERTLEGVANRMDSEDFRWVVLAIQIQHQVGGSLAEVLLTVAHTMRERVQLHRHVRALSAEGRLSAYILVGLPIFFTVYLAVARPTYLRPLYTTSMGLAMIVTAVVLLGIGSLVMKKMVKVEV
jgi:Flp pilus assembly protein TadB